MVLLRTPAFKDSALRQALPPLPGSGGLRWGWALATGQQGQQRDETAAARLGYSNDCFMCNDTTDGGTWYPCAPTADTITYGGRRSICGAPGNPWFDYMTAVTPSPWRRSPLDLV